MRVGLKRGVKLFAVSSALAAATLGLVRLGVSSGLVQRWIADRMASQPDRDGPIMYVHVYWIVPGWGQIVGSLLVYFAVCVALAWGWTWLGTRTTIT